MQDEKSVVVLPTDEQIQRILSRKLPEELKPPEDKTLPANLGKGWARSGLLFVPQN
jgi:hypothetical protein